MPTLGSDSIRVTQGRNYVGKCLFCPQEIVEYDLAYEIFVNETRLALAHDFCFFHLYAVTTKHFERHGIPDLSPPERVS